MDGHVDITAPALVAVIALACGIAMARFKQPAIVGYILAGVVMGPSMLGLVSDSQSIAMLAEFGVLMLLFVIGMELEIKRFIANWRIATFTTLAQIVASVGVMLVLRLALGWSFGLSLVLGFIVALSSTAVVIKILDVSGERSTEAGRLSLGILIAQDMAVAPMLLIVGAFSGEAAGALDLFKIFASVGLLVGVVWILTHKQVALPFGRIIAGDHDLGPLAGLGFCFGAAALAGGLGLSAGYGAFLAGLVLGNTMHRHELLGAIAPVQAVLLMVFFLSVGLLLDVGYIWDNLWLVLGLLMLVTVFKTMLNTVALHLAKVDWTNAFIVGIALAQIGEFSFLLAGQGVAAGLMTGAERQLVVAVTVLSLGLAPLWVATMRRLHRATTGRLASFGEVMGVAYGPEAAFARALCRRAPTLARLLGVKACAVIMRREAGAAFKPARPDLAGGIEPGETVSADKPAADKKEAKADA